MTWLPITLHLKDSNGMTVVHLIILDNWYKCWYDHGHNTYTRTCLGILYQILHLDYWIIWSRNTQIIPFIVNIIPGHSGLIVTHLSLPSIIHLFIWNFVYWLYHSMNWYQPIWCCDNLKILWKNLMQGDNNWNHFWVWNFLYSKDIFKRLYLFSKSSWNIGVWPWWISFLHILLNIWIEEN